MPGKKPWKMISKILKINDVMEIFVGFTDRNGEELLNFVF